MPQHLPLPSSASRRQAGPAATSLQHAASLQFANDRLPWQRSLRWEKPPRGGRRLLLGLLFALLVTVLELGGFALGMRSYRTHPPAPRVAQPMQIVRIEAITETPPPPPEPEPPPFVRRPSKIAIAPPEVHTTPPPASQAEDSNAMRARIGGAAAATPAPAPQLFNPDGSIRLGSAPVLAPPAAPKNTFEAGKARWAEIEKRGNPIDCHKTRFAQAFAPDESAGDKVARKYLKWIGLSDGEAIAHRNAQRAEAGGCEPEPTR
jgi:hypothetical protein